MMQMFMTPAGIAASTPFSDQVWLHGGLDILSVCVLLAALSTVPATKITLRSAAVVGLLPVAAMVFTLVATPFWSPLFLVPAAGCLGFAIYGFVLAARIPATRALPAGADGRRPSKPLQLTARVSSCESSDDRGALRRRRGRSPGQTQ
jgi:hypothetical protein